MSADMNVSIMDMHVRHAMLTCMSLNRTSMSFMVDPAIQVEFEA